MLDNTEQELDTNLTEESNTTENTIDKEVTESIKNSNTSEENVINSEPESEELAMEDYDTFSLEDLTSSLKKLVENEAVQKLKNHINAIKKSFNKQFSVFIATKKEAFIAEGGNEIDFHFKSSIKSTFNGLVNEYRKKVKQHYKQLEDQRNENYTKKVAIIEELKELITNSESNTLYKEFRALQDKWRGIGSIPREKNEDTWQTYRHYEQQVYDLLHLNSDFRNLDFKHNLEEKTKIVERTEELSKDTDVNKAFKELQILHRLWKEEIGPVAREFREEIWNRFSTATKIIHDKRHDLFKELEVKYEENVIKKKEVIEKINSLIEENITSHNIWQNKIKELQTLRDEFFAIGRATKEKSQELWQDLKDATRDFNQHKNSFYKNVKGEHQENLDKKRALIDKAISLKDSDDLEATADKLKGIQAEWKTIGHVPRKFSDKMWNEFRAACNHFFDRLHAVQDEEDKELLVIFEKKKAYLEKLKENIANEVKITIDDVKNNIVEWKQFGQVPTKMRFIESKFNKVIDRLFSTLDIDKNESIMLRFKNNIDSYAEQKNTRKLENEASFLRKKIDEITREVKLLENNLGFFKHTSADNPMVKNVYKNIEKHQKELDLWKQKLNYLRTLEL